MKAREFQVRVVGAKVWDPANDNIDIEVQMRDGRRFAATFFTQENIRCLFEKNAGTGECAGGLYLWSRNMIIVAELTLDAIQRTVEELLATGEFEMAFSQLSDSR